MHPSELQLGDIICFSDEGKKPDHIAMYTGVIIDGKHYVTHSIINDTPGLQTTILKNDRCMHVFRPVNAELGARAAQRLLAWAKYRIPYDSRRANLMSEIQNEINMRALGQTKEESIDSILRYYSEIAKTKFYEQIKFAARRDTCPVKMFDGVQSRGFTCVQSVILAYQVEELAQYVKTLEQVKNELASLGATTEQITDAWISDKDCSHQIMAIYDLPESYEQYATALRSSKEFSGFYINSKRVSTHIHTHYHPSLVAWDYDQEPSIDSFIQKFDPCLDLPAKICSPSVLHWFMQKETRHWVSMGSLETNLLPLTFSYDEVKKHRIRKENIELEIAYNRRQIYSKWEVYNPSLTASHSSLTGTTSPGFPSRSQPPSVSSVSTRGGITSAEAQEKNKSQLDPAGFNNPLIECKYPKKLLGV